ncbi:MAG: serine hydrolase domain-containing protein [Pseudomonadota bacterium]
MNNCPCIVTAIPADGPPKVVAHASSRHRNHVVASLTLSSVVLLLGTCAHAPVRPATLSSGDYTSTIAYLSELIRYEMNKHSVTGMSIALVDDQHVVWAHGFGYADKERGVQATPDTVYRVGSVSKLFTDTAAMQLKDLGRLDLDAPVERYVPDFSIRSRFSGAITPRNLMTHHSGLPRDLRHPQGTDSEAPDELVTVLKESDAVYPPGFILSYSNEGISLLGTAIQNIAQESFVDHIRSSLLEPLRMSNSSFDPGPSASPLMSRGYIEGKVARDTVLRICNEPAGGLSSSVADLSKFLEMVFAGGRYDERQILSAESLAEMFKQQNDAVPLDLGFHVGLGWFLDESSIQKAGPIASHGGALPPFFGNLSALPEQKLGVIVLTNSMGGSDVVNRIAIEALKLAFEVKTGIRQPEPRERPKVEIAKRPLASATVREYVGDYTTIRGLIRVYERDGHLYVRLKGRELRLVPRADGKLGFEYKWLGIYRVNLGPLSDLAISRRTLAGREIIVATMGDRDLLIGERLSRVPELGKWRERLGEYELVGGCDVESGMAKANFSAANGELVAEIPGGRLEFMPMSDDEAVEVGPLAGVGEVLRRIEASGEERLRFRGYVYRKRNR